MKVKYFFCIVFLTILFPTVKSATISTFNDSSSAINLTFTAEENQTAYVDVPKGYANLVTAAVVNISGFESGNDYPTFNYSEVADCQGNHRTNFAGPLGDTSTRMLNTTWFLLNTTGNLTRVTIPQSQTQVLNNPEDFIYTVYMCPTTITNFSILSSQDGNCTQSYDLLNSSFRLPNPVPSVGLEINFENSYLANYSYNHILKLNSSNSSNDDGNSDVIYLYAYECTDGNLRSLTQHNDSTFNVDYYNSSYAMNIYATPYPKELTLDVGDDGDNEYSNEYLYTSDNAVSDFTTEVNAFLSTCTADVNGDCQLPLRVYSSENGIAQLDALEITTDNILTNCSGGGNETLLVNLYNETDQVNVSGTLEATFFFYHSNNLVGNESFSMEGSDNYTFCLLGDQDYLVDMDARYFDTGNYEVRSWFLDNVTLTNNASQTINMYMVTDAESDGISIHVQDNSGNDVTNALIQVQRYYMDSAEYRTVTIGKTDDNGDVYIYLISYDVWYRFIIVQDGEVLGTIDPLQIKDTDLILTTEEAGLMELFNYWDRIAYTCTENTATLVFSCTVTDTSGLMHQVCLEVEQFQAITNTIACDTCSPYSTGMVLTCNNVNSTANKYHYTLYSTMNESYVIDSGFLENISDTLIYGIDGLLISAIFIGTVSMIGIFNPAAGVIMVLAGLGVSFLMGLIVMQYATFVSIVVVGLILIFKMRS